MSTINAKKEIRQQAIKMLVTEDLSKWSHRHDVATIDALREANKREEAQSDAQRQSTGQLFSDWYDTLPYGEPSYQETFEAGFEHGASSQQVEAADARYKFALDEWMNKTEWVQKTSKPRELGMHRADILKARIEALEKAQQVALPQVAQARWCPDVCPFTGLPFFMWIEHHETGVMTPTYGGPYDSYTIPERSESGSYLRERYDHDRGGWLIDECEDIGIQIVDDQLYVSDEEPQAERFPMTDEELRSVVDPFFCGGMSDDAFAIDLPVYRAIEAHRHIGVKP